MMPAIPGIVSNVSVAQGEATEVNLTYIGSTNNTGGGTTATFTNHAIGAASSDRLVVVGINYEDPGQPVISGVTIGGVSATEAVQVQSSNRGCSGIFYLKVTSGTTADIVVTYALGIDRSRINVWTIKDQGQDAAVATDSGNAASGTGLSMSVDIPANGCAIAVDTHGTGGTTTTWTGATDSHEGNIGSGTYGSAAETQPTGSARNAHTISTSHSNSTQGIAACCAVWTFGAPPPLDTRSISVSANQGNHTLRSLANTDGYNGTDDLDLTVTYTVDQFGTGTSTALLRTGTIPNTNGQSKITIIINSGVDLVSKGGNGGDGGDGDDASPFNGQPGSVGQDCILINTGDTAIPVTITNNGTYSSGGGGGGGGGARTGAGGSAPLANDGSAGGSTTGGAGGLGDNTAGDGGAGGDRGQAGNTGIAGVASGGSGGSAGTALDKNGHTVTENGSGSRFGPVTA